MRRVLMFCLCSLLASAGVADDSTQQTQLSAPAAVTPAAPGAAPTTTPATVKAPTPNPAPAQGGLGSGVSQTNPLTVLLGLGFILLLIFASAWLMRRMGGMNFSGQSGLKILTGLSVGPREKVLLLEAGDKQILIGVASGSVSHLQTFDQPIIDSDARASGDFSQRLRSMLANKTPGAGGERQ